MNCFEPAPELYSDIVRYPHIVSMIPYVLTFRALYQKQNENFKSFSKLLLWHTIANKSKIKIFETEKMTEDGTVVIVVGPSATATSFSSSPIFLYFQIPQTPISQLISCNNVFVFPPITDSHYLYSLVSICSVTTTTLFLVIISVITIPFRLRALRKVASKKTIEIQKMSFFMSEFLKVSIGNEPLDTKYQFVYILMPYHGTAATVSMVCFTRPVREKIIQSFRFGVKAKVEEIKKDTKTMG
ncbi:Protein CBG23217 [Caenorhabditis briggsae]|uniref:Protein CBG23217 n=1 Tax=Caenorhabditis briggsae TaxID=6238 RepID=A8Y4F6_CAEBR|nr:Protein CBG23217 [Caenorhabditis briggsae]CAP39776.1 Protein CBG23217 [Caenorhabditis briggsae]